VPRRLITAQDLRLAGRPGREEGHLQQAQSDNAYAYTAEGDPNTGIIIGDDAVLVLDTQATPVMAQDVIRRIREVTDKPIKYVLLTHYHAVRVLGASAYGRAHHRQPGHLRPDRRARRAGQGQRDRPLPAPVPQRRERAAPA
jgi:glyoxylase-like metal-dependent hydrolase (beta-lactamase superfamily II)